MAPAHMTKTEISYLAHVAHGVGLTEIGKTVQATEREVDTLLLGAQHKLGA